MFFGQCNNISPNQVNIMTWISIIVNYVIIMWLLFEESSHMKKSIQNRT